MNRATLIGFVGADPEMRHLNNGNPVVNLRLATSETWKDKTTGERKETTEWHSIVIYNENIGKIVAQYVKKGARILIEGQIKTRTYEKEGQKHYATDIVLGQFSGNVQLLDRAERRGPAEPDSYGQTRTREDAPRTASTGQTGGQRYNDLDDDIPF